MKWPISFASPKKRVIRLEPVYLCVLAILVVQHWRISRNVDWTGVMLHVGYLVPFFDKPWLSIIFWTLAIEFQFYIFLGLLFPLFNSSRRGLQS